MTTAPYRDAETLRRCHAAHAARDPLAVDINSTGLSVHDYADTFARRQDGVPHCELRPQQNLCPADAEFLTAKRGHINSIRLACHDHLVNFLNSQHANSWITVLPLAASTSHQRWAAQLQETHRLMLAPVNRLHQLSLQKVENLLRRLLIPHGQLDLICAQKCCAPYRDDANKSHDLPDLRHRTAPPKW